MALGAEELTSPATIKAAVAEFVATALFIFVGVGSIVGTLLSGSTAESVALAHGLAIALLVAGIGPISGGHINPAVTFAAVITNRITVTRGAMYIVAQLLGAVVGAFLLRALIADGVLNEIGGAGGHQLADQTIPEINDKIIQGPVIGMLLEATLTFVLVWTVFATAIHPKNSTVIAPLAIGFAILVIHLVAIPLTGAGVNPARTFGPAVAFNEWGDHWVYWVGPLLGGSVAGLLYYFLYIMEEERAPAAAA
jgi:aquaporin TIP